MSQPGAIDLNADLGEGFPNDAKLLGLVTSASVSCGAHAGDTETILATLDEAKARGVAVGAHPGFADRAGFGRIERSATADEVERLIVAQCEFLADLASRVGLTLRFVKPHGALYNQAQKDPEIAAGVVAAARRLGLPVLGQPSSILASRLGEAGVGFVAEGFPDRRYEPDGRLTPRDRPGALLRPDEVEAQVVGLAAKGFDTLCVHGDHPDAVRNAEAVLAVLKRHGLAARFWAPGG
jgi:5-oxoprolinase (ATP-hydrolysing) subunit A